MSFQFDYDGRKSKTYMLIMQSKYGIDEYDKIRKNSRVKGSKEFHVIFDL